MQHRRHQTFRASLFKAIVVVGLLAPQLANGFIGVLGGRDRGACERDGGLCYTEDACCTDYSCQKASYAAYGRCTPTKARLLDGRNDNDEESLNGEGGAGGSGTCTANTDCPPGQCCGVEFYGTRALAYRRVCKPGPADGSDCPTAGGVEQNLFNQYYSGLFR